VVVEERERGDLVFEDNAGACLLTSNPFVQGREGFWTSLGKLLYWIVLNKGSFPAYLHPSVVKRLCGEIIEIGDLRGLTSAYDSMLDLVEDSDSFAEPGALSQFLFDNDYNIGGYLASLTTPVEKLREKKRLLAIFTLHVRSERKRKPPIRLLAPVLTISPPACRRPAEHGQRLQQEQHSPQPHLRLHIPHSLPASRDNPRSTQQHGP
jgi:hypothetical protein